MHILFDARMLCRPRSGIGYYIENLLQALAEIDSENHYTLCLLPGERETAFQPERYPNFRTRTLRLPTPVSLRLFRDSSPLYRLMRASARRYDLVHEPAYEPLPLAPRSVVTIHDMILFRRPADFPPAFASRYQRRVRESARNAMHILTDSEHTRRDVIELLDVPPDKVSTVRLGVRPEAFDTGLSDAQAHRELAAPGIGAPFLLSIGDLYRRKNNITLVRAFARLPEELRQAHQLVIAGAAKEPETLQELHAEIEASRLQERVLLTGYVSDTARKVLMTHARVLVYPSLYEGFGLPPLEAMACGIPTASSDNTSIPEVVGDAGLLVRDFLEPDAWAGALARLLTDDPLRRKLVQKGRARARTFTWERTARETLRVYERAARPAAGPQNFRY